NVQLCRPLTISTLAHYFGLQCDEFLRLSLSSEIESKYSNTSKNSLTKQRGISFEDSIKSYHSSSILSDIHDEYEFLSYLRSSISKPTEFRIGYNIKFQWKYDKHIQSDYRPDFLLIKHLNNNEKQIEITIAEAKSSSRIRIEHCIQVTFYAIDLTVWIKQNKLDQYVFINDIGEIWLPTHLLIRSFFHSSLFSSINIQRILDHSNNDNYYSDDKIKLQRILPINTKDKTSTVIQALQTHELQLKQQSSLLILKQNNDLILLFIVLIPDPSQFHSVALFAYNIYDISNQSWFSIEPIIQTYPSPSQMVSIIAQSLGELRQQSQRPCQIILFDEQERTILFEQLTLASDNEQIEQCLILLKSSENAILLHHPPDVIQTDQLYERHDSSSNYNKKSTKAELVQQLRQLNEGKQEKARQNLIRLPCLICLHTAIRQSFVVPIPGYFDLEDLKRSFKISLTSCSLSQLFESIHSAEIANLVQEHLNVLAHLYLIVQQRLSKSNRLQLDACLLPDITPINSSHLYIRRLIFLCQYEMLHTLRSIQETRFNLTEPLVLIRVLAKIPIDKHNNLWKCKIERGHEIISKKLTENLQNTNCFHTYPYLISKDSYSIQTFSDTVYMDLAIDGIRSRTKLDQYGLAHVEQQKQEESIFIRVKLSNFTLEIDHQYYLSERYVDFNTKKAIQALEQTT
ncbi:unnamed protein product, partial [Rotaria sp. Silwood2]